jgi:hypothetical protein
MLRFYEIEYFQSWKEKLVKLCYPYYLSDTLNAASPKLKYWSGQRSSKEMRYHNSETARKGGCQRKLSRYQKFILTLMRLRLNLLTFFLADLFGTSQSRVSQISNICYLDQLHA